MVTEFETKLLGVMMMVIMMGMGASLTWRDFLIAFRKPKGVLVGVFCQYGIMPLLAFLLARALDLSPGLTVGLILMGCMPGGTTSNIFTYFSKAVLAVSGSNGHVDLRKLLLELAARGANEVLVAVAVVLLAVPIGTAAAIPGTLVNLAAGGGARTAVRFGHPSGTLRVGAQAQQVDGQWTVTKAIMSRSARVLMEGWVRIPGDSF